MTTSRTRDVHETRAKIRVSVDADRPLPIVADGELLGTTPRDVPAGAPIDPVQAMTADHEDPRRERLAAEAAEERLEAVIVTPSPDWCTSRATDRCC